MYRYVKTAIIVIIVIRKIVLKSFFFNYLIGSLRDNIAYCKKFIYPTGIGTCICTYYKTIDV